MSTERCRTNPRTLRLLVVDDHDLVRRSICHLLDSEDDMEVICEAADGADAVCKAREHDPDFVLMDVTMPTMNGFEATRIITQELPAVRIVMITQYNSPTMLQEAMAAGASGFVVKSDATRDLIPEVRRIRELRTRT